VGLVAGGSAMGEAQTTLIRLPSTVAARTAGSHPSWPRVGASQGAGVTL